MTSGELLSNYKKEESIAKAKPGFFGAFIDYWKFLRKEGFLYAWKAKNKRGEEVIFYKIQTLAPNSAIPPGGADLNSKGKVIGQKPYNIVAKIIRGSHLDELPQLLNFYRGDMNVFGRRPYREEEMIKNFSGEDLEERINNPPSLINVDYWCQGENWEETVKNGTKWLREYREYKHRHGHTLKPTIQALGKFFYNKVIKGNKSE